MNKTIALFLGMALLATQAAFAQETEFGPTKEQGLWQTVIMIGIAMLFFYLILWRPEQKRRKALDQLRNSMKKGDKVVAMGILGTVVRAEEHTVVLKMYDGAKIEVLKGAITEVAPGPEAESEPDAK